jgi:hypothetical protein
MRCRTVRFAAIAAATVVSAVLVLGASAAGAAAKVHVEPLVNFALPPTTSGCGGAIALTGGAERLPITVSTVAGQVAEVVNVCIEGQGPYAFFIDSGAGESIIDAHLAARLHLAHDGSATGFDGVGCQGRAQPVSLSSWSVDGVALATQSMIAATLPDFGTRGKPVGLLGSDVLSRFGAVRIDFRQQTLTLGGPEVASLGTSARHGPIGPPLSTVLTQGQVGTTVPLNVVLTPGDISLNVRLRLGKGPAYDFVVDTGSSQSIVDSSLAKSDHLAHTDLAQKQTTVCSTITVPLVQSGRWSIPGVTLRPQLLATAAFGQIGSGGLAGLLGSDQLKHFGWLIFDYRGARLILG